MENLSLSLQQGKNCIEVHFEKGDAEAVNIYTRIEGEVDWKFLARDTHSPYIDNRPIAKNGIPEDREYIATRVINDIEVGEPSDSAVIMFA